MADDMKFFGLDDEIADVPRETEVETESYTVWSDNLLTLQLFLRLENKWNVVIAPDGELIRTGIWFPNIEGVLRTTNGIPKRKWPEVLADLEAMEDAALEAMHKVQGERREKRLREMQTKHWQK
ncbi:DUF1799 domain-containing protein [Massilia cellulosiltytica]|jgi:hypothetical protein|uniref:DUF1799 domain-containing protein n=1 Tax=Massilia cellulosiltytica TaxID=2683234 RepID=UPI0039B3CC8D